MQFIAICRDAPDSRIKRPEVREQHLEYWRPMEEEGQIILAGPMTDFAGSVFILEAPDEDKVRGWLANDPYFAQGVFESFELHPFKCVLPLDVYGV